MREQHGLTTALIPWVVTAVLFLVLGSGCSGTTPRRKVASTEPPLTIGSDGGASVAVSPARTVTWVDRHPLFYKPRDYYDTSGDNKVVKAAAATVIGIPVGLFGELRQIVVGAPAETRY